MKKPRITSILNIKGGTAKSLTAEMIGRSYAAIGRKTLLVDADGQGDLSMMIMPQEDFEESDSTLREAVTGKKSFDECIRYTGIDNLYLIPANMKLFDSMNEILSMSANETIFRRKLKQLDFDEIVIDNNPSKNRLINNSIVAADQIICPSSVGKKTINGIMHTWQEVDKIVEEYAFEKPPTFTILLTMFQRNNNNKEVKKILEERFPGAVMESTIRFQQKPIQDAELNDRSLLMDQKSGVAEDYRRMFSELLTRENGGGF